MSKEFKKKLKKLKEASRLLEKENRQLKLGRIGMIASRKIKNEKIRELRGACSSLTKAGIELKKEVEFLQNTNRQLKESYENHIARLEDQLFEQQKCSGEAILNIKQLLNI